MNDLMEYGTVQRGFIGVSIRDLDSEFAKEKEIKSLQGVYVNGITEDGAAESAGIKEGDVITSINGSLIKSSPELQEQVGRYRPGDTIDVTVMRSGNEKVYAVTLRNKDGNTKVVKNESISMLGATLVSLSDSELDKLNISKGIKVKDLSTGKLKSAGIKEGFIIISIDNKTVGSVEELTNYLNNKKGGVLIEGVYPNGMRAYYGFGM